MNELSGHCSNTRGLPGRIAATASITAGNGSSSSSTEIGEILGLGPGRLDAGDYRLADIAHAVVGQRRVGAVAMGGELGPGLEDVEAGRCRPG